MARTYTHLLTARSCEAPGCTVKASRCGIYREPGGAVIACSRSHAREADRRLSQRDQERRTACQS